MMTERQKKAAYALPRGARSTVKQSFENGKSLRVAVDAYCLMCKQGNRYDIERCTDEICPLRLVRPFQATTEASTAPSA